jgi:hypothetical protein
MPEWHVLLGIDQMIDDDKAVTIRITPAVKLEIL